MILLRAFIETIITCIKIYLIYSLITFIMLMVGGYMLQHYNWEDKKLFQEETLFLRQKLEIPNEAVIIVNYLPWYHPYSLGTALKGGWLNGAMFFDKEAQNFKIFISTRVTNSEEFTVLAHELKHVHQHLFIPEEVPNADHALEYSDRVLEEQARLYAEILTLEYKLYDNNGNSP